MYVIYEKDYEEILRGMVFDTKDDAKEYLSEHGQSDINGKHSDYQIYYLQELEENDY